MNPSPRPLLKMEPSSGRRRKDRGVALPVQTALASGKDKHLRQIGERLEAPLHTLALEIGIRLWQLPNEPVSFIAERRVG